MKRLCAREDARATFAAVLGVVFATQRELWRLLDPQTALRLSGVSRNARKTLQMWLEAAVSDVSLGKELFPVPVQFPARDSHPRLAIAMGLMDFSYATAVRHRLVGDQHRLPPEILRRQQSNERCRRILRGRQVQVVVTACGSKGWGVCAAQRIRQGEYVGQYTGELISSSEARRRYQNRYDREERNYVLALREHVARQDVVALRFDVVRTNVDASSCGSVTRFINHSCAPNLEVAAVRVDSYVPRLELFASKPIQRGEELSFDYGAGSSVDVAALLAIHYICLEGGLLFGYSMSDLVSQSLVKIWAFAMEKTYDELCEDASAAAETRLLDHFKQHGGEVWAIGAGCQSCRQKLADASGLKCGVISTFQRVRKTALSAPQLRRFRPLKEKLEALSWTTSAKKPEEPTVVGIAASIGMATSELPGWFFTLDFELVRALLALESKERQKILYQAALELYGLLMDEECWTRDKDSFPRSSYTLVDVRALNPHPEPPATQALPFEARSFFGVVDSLLQIR
ncbi:hypothetical protein BBJ28_00021000 [Nothophytophthora sp. Chile5]|nr:hypothetical protein BBJ28_00021000 [Nothophytophthora sp. Chile5]